MKEKRDIKATIVQSNKANNDRDVYDFLFRELLEMKKSQVKKKQFDKSKLSMPLIKRRLILSHNKYQTLKGGET